MNPEQQRILADNRAHSQYIAEHGKLPLQERWWYVSIYKKMWKLESRPCQTEFDAHNLKDTLNQLNPKIYFVVSLTVDEAKTLHGDS